MEEKRWELIKQDHHSLLNAFYVILAIALIYTAFRFLNDYYKEVKKKPRYRVNSHPVKCVITWYIEERHFFYFVPLHGTFKTEELAQEKCNELNLNNK